LDRPQPAERRARRNLHGNSRLPPSPGDWGPKGMDTGLLRDVENVVEPEALFFLKCCFGMMSAILAHFYLILSIQPSA
jgi:hypothetical protein